MTEATSDNSRVEDTLNDFNIDIYIPSSNSLCVVEDDPAFEFFLKDFLANNGYSVDHYINLESLLDTFGYEPREYKLAAPAIASHYSKMLLDWTQQCKIRPSDLVNSVHEYQINANKRLVEDPKFNKFGLSPYPLLRAVYYSGRPERGFSLTRNSVWLMKPSTGNEILKALRFSEV